MSRIRADRIVDRAATGAPLFPNGAVVTGVATATTFSGNATTATTATTATNAQGLTGTPNIVVGSVTGTTGSFSSNVSVGGTLTYEDVTNIDSIGIVTARTGIKVLAGGINAVGVVTATSFSGDGSNLSGVVSGIDIESGGSFLGAGVTSINFQSGATVTASGAGSTITISAGISTTASSPAANTVVTLNLSTAQHHDLTLTAGITTVTCSGGVFGESHSVVISQPSSGIATVGFSTFFLFPSGSTPSMSTGSS